MILELTTPDPGFWRSTYRFYLNGLLPKIAKKFTKNSAPYEYLADSIMNFPTRKEFLVLMESMGLKKCQGHSTHIWSVHIVYRREISLPLKAQQLNKC